jgi:hypothetical protein
MVEMEIFILNSADVSGKARNFLAADKVLKGKLRHIEENYPSD